jgi:hypothetical protein
MNCTQNVKQQREIGLDFIMFTFHFAFSSAVVVQSTVVVALNEEEKTTNCRLNVDSNAILHVISLVVAPVPCAGETPKKIKVMKKTLQMFYDNH